MGQVCKETDAKYFLNERTLVRARVAATRVHQFTFYLPTAVAHLTAFNTNCIIFRNVEISKKK
jgi:hypothetical protein